MNIEFPSEKELQVFVEAFRYMLKDPPAEVKGVLFLSLDGSDPPQSFLGSIFRPVSRSVMTHYALDDPDGIHNEPDDPFGPADKGIHDRVTGESGTVLKVKILEWLDNDGVKIECESYTGPSWAGGYILVLKLKKGQWRFHEMDLDSYWISELKKNGCFRTNVPKVAWHICESARDFRIADGRIDLGLEWPDGYDAYP